jgi:hypothetical protein
MPAKYPDNKISLSSNCYDASIKYTDHIIDELIKILDSREQPGALLYFSDHGEDIIRGTGHTKKPTYDVFKIPLLGYFTSAYKERYPEKIVALKSNSKKIIVNDQLFQTFLGIFGVETNLKDDTSDLSSSEFISHSKIYRGKKSVFDSNNYELHTKNKLKELQSGSNHKNIKLHLGPILHPFHLRYVNGRKNYPFVALNVFHDDDQIWIESLSETRISLQTALGYMNFPENTEIVINV